MCRSAKRPTTAWAVLTSLVCAAVAVSCSTVRDPSGGSEPAGAAASSTACFARVGTSHHQRADEGPFWELLRLELSPAAGGGSVAGNDSMTGELGILLRTEPYTNIIAIEADVACAAPDDGRRACALDCGTGAFEISEQAAGAAIRLAGGAGGMDLAACASVEPAIDRGRVPTITAGEMFSLYSCDR